MAQNSFALMTNLGRAKEAAALANGTAIVITHIAIGDSATVPSGGETALYNEVARKAISGHGTVVGAANTAYFDIFLAAADGPYTIREAGLYDSAGDLIAIARYDPPISKPVPSSGQTVEGTVRLQVAFSNIANVTIVVDPSFTVPLQRLSRLPWIPVLSMSVTAPPASPAIGDAYLVPTGSTGSWAGQAGKIAEFAAAGWGILTPPNGHGISLPDGRVFEKIGGTYIEKPALDVQSGKWTYGVAAGAANAITVALSPIPAALVAGLSVALQVSANNTAAVTLNVNGLGAKAILNRSGAALKAGDLIAGNIYGVTYNGTTFILDGLAYSDLLVSPTLGSLLAMKLISTVGTSTYTPSPGTKFIIVEGVGGGGSGGGAVASGSGNCAAGGGGSSGAFGKRLITDPTPQTVVIGAGGTGTQGAAGSSGGATSFGSLMTLPGGVGGGIGNAASASSVRGAVGTSSSPSGIDYGSRGSGALFGFALSASSAVGGNGGSSPFGNGGPASGLNGTAGTDGNSAIGFGGGGGGAVGVNNVNTYSGGNGGGGLLVIWEYAGG